MRSKHLVDPELLVGLDAMPSFTFSAEVLPMIRDAMAAMSAERGVTAPDPAEAGVRVEKRTIAGADGHGIGVLVCTPLAPVEGLRPGVLHIHGGGYVIGSAEMTSDSNRKLAVDADCVIVSVDYRLAPETPHPGPVEDCYAALKWLHDHAASLGVDPARIALAGESAGAGLAAALALLARDRGEVAIRHQHLTYPMIDDRTAVGDPHPFTGEFVWTPESNHYGWSCLLGHAPGGEGVSPYAAAARAEDLSGLPSTYIAVGALDLFVEEDIEFARRLIRAGVPTELHVYPGAYHGFELAAEAAIVHKAHANSLAALRRALHPEVSVEPAA